VHEPRRIQRMLTRHGVQSLMGECSQPVIDARNEAIDGARSEVLPPMTISRR
jgi:hypothetical protein